MKNNQNTTNALCRLHLFYFVWEAHQQLNPGTDFKPNWHIELLSHELQKTLESPGRRLIVTCPPRYGKSFIMSICFIAWAMGHDPSLRFLVASYSEALADEHADTFKKLIESDWYKSLFPKMRVDPKKTRASDIQSTKGGRRKAISRNGTATGFGADIIVIDDIIKAADATSPVERRKAQEYYEQTLFSRLNDKKKGQIVANQQRFHEDDPAAALIEKGFEHVCLRAIAEEDEAWELYDGKVYRRARGKALFPELEDIEQLQEIKSMISPPVFSAQYQQNPVNPGGNRISWDRLQFYDPDVFPYARSEYTCIVQSWDTASLAEPDSDYSACTTVGLHKTGKWHIIDVARARLAYDKLRERALYLARHYKPDGIVIEMAGSGYALISDMREHLCGGRPSLSQVHVSAYSPRVGKEERAFTRQHKLEDGTFLLPERATWLSDFRHELTAFPVGKNDDQVDSLIQAIDYLETGAGRSLVERDPVTFRPRSPHRRVRR